MQMHCADPSSSFSCLARVELFSSCVGRVFVATAGWSIPREVAHHFPGEGAHLVRYARVLDGAEINSTFHRRHRAATFVRWASSVPPTFRFACKVPRTITHDQKLVGTHALLDEFLEDISGLGDRVGPLLVQLPGKLAFDRVRAERFFARLRSRFAGPVACEPRGESWYGAEATALFAAHGIARVVADPPRPADAMEPAGSTRLRYFRLHGSPRTYWSAYEEPFLARLAHNIVAASRRADVWCVFDNTAGGEAAGNALRLRALLAELAAGGMKLGQASCDGQDARPT